MGDLRLLVIDDHAMFRAGLRMVLLAGFPHIDIVESGSIGDALRDVAHAPDVVLLDIRLPGLNGLDGMALLKRKWSNVPILMLSSEDEPQTIEQTLVNGASGFVSKAQSADAIISAVQRVARGEVLPQGTRKSTTDQRLTPRQFEVLDLLCRGLSNKLIARELDLSENTVRTHVQALLAHFNAGSRAEAVYEARRKGLIH